MTLTVKLNGVVFSVSSAVIVNVYEGVVDASKALSKDIDPLTFIMKSLLGSPSENDHTICLGQHSKYMYALGYQVK